MTTINSCQSDITYTPGLVADAASPASHVVQDPRVAHPVDTRVDTQDDHTQHTDSVDTSTRDDASEKSNDLTYCHGDRQESADRTNDRPPPRTLIWRATSITLFVPLVLFRYLAIALNYLFGILSRASKGTEARLIQVPDQEVSKRIQNAKARLTDTKLEYDDCQRDIKFITDNPDKPTRTSFTHVRVELDTGWDDNILSRAVAEKIPYTKIEYFKDGSRSTHDLADLTSFKACGTITLRWSPENAPRRPRFFHLHPMVYTTKFYVSERYDMAFDALIGKETINKEKFWRPQGRWARRQTRKPPRRGWFPTLHIPLFSRSLTPSSRPRS